jgi:hypothetical protein
VRSEVLEAVIMNINAFCDNAMQPHGCVPTFQIILLPASSWQMQFQHTSTGLHGFTSQKAISIKMRFIPSDRVIRKLMADF